MNYFLVLSYDGTEFNGWQAQGKANLRTVQETLEKTAEEIFRSPVRITASGRTDAGVHALGQVCSFAVDTTIPPERLADCFNTKLPPDVRVQKSGVAPDDFDACRSAKRKTYVYSCYLSERENPLKERYCVRVGQGGILNLEAMRSAAALVKGEHDFKAFCAANSSAKTTIRTMYEVKIFSEQTLTGEEIRIYITGNGFLYNMVRTLAGTFLEIGCGRKSKEDLQKTLALSDRNGVGRTMPARGLCLLSVEYGGILSNFH